MNTGFTLSDSDRVRIQAFIDAGKRIQAVKYYTTISGVKLAEAKKTVEYLFPLTPTERKKNKVVKVVAGVITLFVAIIVIASVSGSGDETVASTSEPAKTYTTGEIVHTNLFDVVVNKASISSKVITGNEFADLSEKPGSKYLILNVTWKNTSQESRIILDGELLVTVNGKPYVFDKTESIMLEGWGLMLDQINPLTSITTNLVWQVPDDLTGNIYYHPGRTDDDIKILVGKL